MTRAFATVPGGHGSPYPKTTIPQRPEPRRAAQAERVNVPLLRGARLQTCTACGAVEMSSHGDPETFRCLGCLQDEAAERAGLG